MRYWWVTVVKFTSMHDVYWDHKISQITTVQLPASTITIPKSTVTVKECPPSPSLPGSPPIQWVRARGNGGTIPLPSWTIYYHQKAYYYYQIIQGINRLFLFEMVKTSLFMANWMVKIFIPPLGGPEIVLTRRQVKVAIMQVAVWIQWEAMTVAVSSVVVVEPFVSWHILISTTSAILASKIQKVINRIAWLKLTAYYSWLWYSQVIFP